MSHRKGRDGLIINDKTMSKDVYIQYCGPYSIQTSDATRISQSIESTSFTIERAQLRDTEQMVIIDGGNQE